MVQTPNGLPGPVLVTGATGTLGRPTVTALRAAGHEVRALSRKAGGGRTVADLRTGHGLAAALAGVHTVVHLATTATRDATLARTLTAATREAGTAHLVLMSIVGIDRVPLPYYRTKLAAERIVEASGVPYTILRATQFYDLLARLFAAQRFSPVLWAPDLCFQPIAVREVASRIAELVATGTPVGRARDIGGPQTRTARDLAEVWSRATGSRRPLRSVRLPGRTFAAYAAGHHLAAGPPFGQVTFEEYLAER